MNRKGSVCSILLMVLFSFSLPVDGWTACTPAPSGMVSWWKAEGNASDFIGNNNGTWVNGPGYTLGKVGQAFSLGGNDDYVQVSSPVGLPTGNSARTMMLWFKTPSSWGDSFQVVIQYGGNNSGEKFGLYVPEYWARTLSFWGEASDFPGSTPLQLDTWYQGAVTYDGSTVRLYLNGQLETSQVMSLNTQINSNGFIIGGAARPPDQITSQWNGLVDEAAIFNRALSAEEIAAVYNAGSGGLCGLFDSIPGLRLWLKADSGVITGGDNVTTWEDRSGNGLDVAQSTEDNRPTRVTTVLNGMPVVRFDGINDYLIRAAVPGYDLFDNNSDTVFIVQKQAGSDPRTTTFSWTSDGTNRFMVHATWEDLISYQVGNAGGGGYVQADQPYGWDDQWHVLKLTRDGNDGRIVVDGIALTPTVNFSSPGNNSVTADLYVGSDYWTVNNLSSSTNWFTGDVAEILVFKRALTSEEQQTVENYILAKYGLTNTPNSFSFTDKVDQPLNSRIESDSITISGINILAPISVSAGGDYSINGGAYSSTPGIVKNGDIVTVRQTSSGSFSTRTDVVLTIGGVSDTFSVTTRDAFLYLPLILKN